MLTFAVVDFFNHANMLYGTISEFCTPAEVSELPWWNARSHAHCAPTADACKCPVMNAGPK